MYFLDSTSKMASNIVFVLFVLNIQKSTRSIMMDTLNACEAYPKGVFYCCADYEERNNACVACKIGFKSRNGQPCTPCKNNFYGTGCVSQCNCSSLQRCDNINGCVSRQAITVSTEHQNAVNITTKTTIEKGFEDDPKGISMPDLIIYVGSITGIIVILGLCHCFNKNRRKTEITSTPAIIKNTHPAENDSARNETFELDASIYHVIDENRMENSAAHAYPFLEVVGDSSII